jgi:hypothetical protein
MSNNLAKNWKKFILEIGPIRPEDYELIYELVLLQKAFIAQGKMDEKGPLGGVRKSENDHGILPKPTSI